MEGGRVSHSWCMCVVVMAMVGWMGAGMELVLGKHAGASVELHGVQPTGCMDNEPREPSRGVPC